MVQIIHVRCKGGRRLHIVLKAMFVHQQADGGGIPHDPAFTTGRTPVGHFHHLLKQILTYDTAGMDLVLKFREV